MANRPRTHVSTLGRLLLVTLLCAAGAAPAVAQPTKADIEAALKAAHAKYKSLEEGKNADYIPALQSISKVFTLAQVLQQRGEAAVEDTIGVDATGQVFNSIVAIEQFKGQEMNSFVNPGAIATTSMVTGATEKDIWASILGFESAFAGRALAVNEEVYRSESETNQRNQAIAMLMYAYGRIKENPARATDLYTRQCSINVTAKDLAVMAATLANGGTNPVTRKAVVDAKHVAGVLAVMATAGLYDDSGKWLFHTGLPAKSGVGGGIIAVSPGKFGIAAFSPPLDAAGNSVRAQKAIRDISNALGGNPYAIVPRKD